MFFTIDGRIIELCNIVVIGQNESCQSSLVNHDLVPLPSFTPASFLLDPRNPRNLAQPNTSLRPQLQANEPNRFVASHSISQLNPYMSNMQWSIRVRFEKKTPFRFFENRLSGLPGQFMRALVYDRSLFIEIVAFDEFSIMCDQAFNILNDPKTEYIVKNGSIKTIFNERLCAWPNTIMPSLYEITLTATSEITAIPLSSFETDDVGPTTSGGNSGCSQTNTAGPSNQVDLYKRPEKKTLEMAMTTASNRENNNNKTKRMGFTVVDLRNSNFTKLNKLIFNAPDTFVNVFCVIDEVKEIKTITKAGKHFSNHFQRTMFLADVE